MRLQILDVRKNRLSDIIHKNAVNFLKETIVIMWDNPFESDVKEELTNPKHLFFVDQFDNDPFKIPNQRHLFTEKTKYNNLI